MRLLLLLCLLLLGCRPPASDASSVTTGGIDQVQTGAQVLVESSFSILSGQRVGLIVNHTARVDSLHLIDLIHRAPDVVLAALFGPEHGLRGEADAGEALADGRDARTGAPIYSLYGQTQKPTPAMLSDLDVLVFDIQDIGARFYTFISTMGRAMQAAAEARLPFVVLDRPNPLGGTLVSGFVLEPDFTSFVGQFPIPVVHGLTVGELARMIQGERMLPGLETLDLRVLPMQGWRRSMRWPETELPWVPTSPNIPDFETALLYPGACYFEGTEASEGRGTYEPFKRLGSPWADGSVLAAMLNTRSLPGVRFEAIAFTPRSIQGRASHPKLKDTSLHGIRQVVTDATVFRPVETGIHVLYAFYHQAPDNLRDNFLKTRWLNLLAGTARLHNLLTADATPETIIASWQDEVATFMKRRQTYLLYEG